MKNVSFEDLQNNNQEMNPIVKKIIIAYCDELNTVLNYRNCLFSSRGPGCIDARDEYKQHMDDENDHAEEWLKRLEQMGVIITLDYHQIQDSGSPFEVITTSNVKEQLEKLIKQEMDAVNFYAELVEMAREAKDWVTNRIAKQYMAEELEHATDMRRILEEL